MDTVSQNIPAKMKTILLRMALLFSTYFIFCPRYLTGSFSAFKLTSYPNKALTGDKYCFQNITEVKISNCFQHCLRNCLCTSFQICGSTCQLCSGEGVGIIRDEEGCSYFNFMVDQEKTADQQCQSGCGRDINCCMTSQPCFNGGTCLPQYSTTSRFTCQNCSEGYTGNLCQTPIKSCRGYKNGSQIAQIYKIFDHNMNLYPVVCDFGKDRAWTLIQSYKFANHDYFKASFVANKPNRTKLPNSQSYRLTKKKMKEIAKDSSKWRITCDYNPAEPAEEISYSDYVETSLEKLDILSFNGNRCVEVDYIGIRGINCTNCTAYVLQSHNREVNPYYMGLHFDSRLGPSHSCDHNAINGSHICGKSGEDDFGFFDCYNTNHRCSATSESITSAWLGG